MNNIQLVRRVLADLQAAGLEPLLFGGWGEEVLGRCQDRAVHRPDGLFAGEAGSPPPPPAFWRAKMLSGLRFRPCRWSPLVTEKHRFVVLRAEDFLRT
jgi:hypothetical protein